MPQLPMLPVAALLLVGLAGASCGVLRERQASILQPGVPGAPSRVITAGAAADLAAVQYTAADVRFMQAMIGHHAQALQMTALLRTRSRRPDLRRLAARIDASQADEIEMMRGWLHARGHDAPAGHAAHDHAAAPGMLSSQELESLALAAGPAFDRLFLELMIRHHAGALTMVEELLSMPRAAQEPEIFSFASDVEVDQRMEIDRMTALLHELER